jgi:hypothetical protein
MTEEKLREKLLPCLHCGNIPDVIMEQDKSSPDYGLFHLSCWCGIEVDFNFAEKVIEIWNRRDSNCLK